MMNHTVEFEKELFTISTDTVSDLLLLFQVHPEKGYAYTFNSDGTINIPKNFWGPFSKISKKWVSVSRNSKEG